MSGENSLSRAETSKLSSDKLKSGFLSSRTISSKSDEEISNALSDKAASVNSVPEEISLGSRSPEVSFDKSKSPERFS